MVCWCRGRFCPPCPKTTWTTFCRALSTTPSMEHQPCGVSLVLLDLCSTTSSLVNHWQGLGWSVIRVVCHQGGLSSGWVISRHGGLSSGWVVSHQSGWSLIRVGGLSSGWSLIRVVSHQGGWSLVMVVSHQGGWSLISVVYNRVVFYQSFYCILLIAGSKVTRQCLITIFL